MSNSRIRADRTRSNLRRFLQSAPAGRPVFVQVVNHHANGCPCGYRDGDVIAGPWLDRPLFLDEGWHLTASVGDRFEASGSTDLVRLR